MHPPQIMFSLAAPSIKRIRGQNRLGKRAWSIGRTDRRIEQANRAARARHWA
jgi:hypothetical protein